MRLDKLFNICNIDVIYLMNIFFQSTYIALFVKISMIFVLRYPC